MLVTMTVVAVTVTMTVVTAVLLLLKVLRTTITMKTTIIHDDNDDGAEDSHGHGYVKNDHDDWASGLGTRK